MPIVITILMSSGTRPPRPVEGQVTLTVEVAEVVVAVTDDVEVEDCIQTFTSLYVHICTYV